MKQQIVDEGVRAVPAIGGTCLGYLLQWDWQTIVWIATALYALTQTGILIFKTAVWWSDRKEKKKHENQQ